MSATGHQLEEVQELAVAMAGMAGVGHLTSGDFQGSPQGRGAVPDIIMGTPLGPAGADRARRGG